MKNLVTINSVEVEFVVNDNEIFTNSLQVAEVFEKRHDNVIAQIRALPNDEFNALNFKAVKYTDKKGELRPCYNLTQDGFSLLVMGFTGEKAYKFKVAYINAFNEMKKALKSEPMDEIDLLIHQAKILKENQAKIKSLENKTENLHKEQLKTKHNINRLLNSDNYMTIIAYANLKGIKANSYNSSAKGRLATKLSKEQNALMGAVIDPRYGKINTYDIEILNQIF